MVIHFTHSEQVTVCVVPQICVSLVIKTPKIYAVAEQIQMSAVQMIAYLTIDTLECSEQQ